MIETSGLEKIFQAESVETIALRNINFNVKEGDFVAVMGPSGCGKTTLLNILGMIDNWNTGSYFLLGQDVAKLKEKQRTILRKNHIGFVFQNFNLIEELTVYENVELPLQYLGWKKKARQERVTALLEKMQIAHRSNMFPLQLSGGQQQRVAVARAVVANPPLILADEPTGNLDSMHGEEVMNLLDALNKEGTTIIMVTHSQRDAAFSRRVVHLFDGQIINENLNKLD
ncbi:MAG: phosphonate ABC transporter ATP-binding protein [Bacteroidetes bacterium CG18_big_fil_WC_8_21_14_2_50_41_14]|nr:MAG: phosphonate ABC transporter ATP-binding protein [Bacteroidetes bacterium CG18_big_fil_WC_8_21_14_2_50_41_14]PJB55373.1 MAG: phosphonate ABC transporter ATP-binding protein [Bacteroidetes bacterium CG_4_9_14_3_um_filter_41_19]